MSGFVVHATGLSFVSSYDISRHEAETQQITDANVNKEKENKYPSGDF